MNSACRPRGIGPSIEKLLGRGMESFVMESRPTRALINLDDIAHNVRQVRRAVGPRVLVMAVVKADAYGHGAVPVARTALAGGADRLAVAIVEEGVALREAGIDAPILVMGWTPPGQLALALAHDLDLTVFSPEDARALNDAAARLRRRPRVHIKIDTGMGRLGFRAESAATTAVVERICRLPALDVEGVYTHFAASESDPEFTAQQLEVFGELLAGLRRAGIEFAIRHAANSGAIWGLPPSHLDMVRPGISLYGYHPAGWEAAGRPGMPDLRPALTWVTRVAQVREVGPGTSVSYGRTYVTAGWERLATLPVGYADGFSRGLSGGRGLVLVNGEPVPVVGRVCMDQIVVNVTEAGPVQPGDEVVLLGSQGGWSITADTMGGWLGTISYEVLCGIGRRVPRIYASGGGCVDRT